jgi:crotonobetainyl-CoA:carnitine CoA-transferase CaiB-like acyl-CoA transferase
MTVLCVCTPTSHSKFASILGRCLVANDHPSHRQGILDILQCDPTPEAIQAALLQWNAEDLEDEASKQKMCVTAYRSFEEWDKHPQAAALKGTPPIQLIKIGEAPKRDIKDSPRFPLEGIRVLDLCRVLSGPVCGRTLAGM